MLRTIRWIGVLGKKQRCEEPQSRLAARIEGTAVTTPTRVKLTVYPAIDVDLVTLVLRDVERVVVRIETAILGHGATARPLAEQGG